jgi:hypothetical protein
LHFICLIECNYWVVYIGTIYFQGKWLIWYELYQTLSYKC